MKIRVGNLEVLSSGTIITSEDEPVEFVLHEDFIFRLVFQNTSDNKIDLKANSFSENTIELVHSNFNESLGISNSKLLPLGTLGGKKLFYNYAIYSHGNSPRTKIIHYTFLIGENA